MDADAGLGVCSECPKHLSRWDRGDRSLAADVLMVRQWADQVVAGMRWRARTAFAKLRDGLHVDRSELLLLERMDAIVYLGHNAAPIREVLQAFNRKFHPQLVFATGDPNSIKVSAADRRYRAI